VKPEECYTVDSDAQQMAAFVDRWLRDSDRMASPRYLLGESLNIIAPVIDLPSIAGLHERARAQEVHGRCTDAREAEVG
jgi:hypothetical protein